MLIIWFLVGLITFMVLEILPIVKKLENDTSFVITLAVILDAVIYMLGGPFWALRYIAYRSKPVKLFKIKKNRYGEINIE